jgi:hypothetical protein
MTIDVAFVIVGLALTSGSCPFEGASTPPFISKGRGYKEGSRYGYNMVLIMTLSLLVYFTYIFIDISIYALGGTPYDPLNFSGWWGES